MDRTFPTRPWVAVGVLIMRGDRLLVVQRGREPGKGMWALPGGMIEVGETAREAAAREALEETGLHVEVGELFWLVDGIRRDDDARVRYHNVILDFLAEAPEGEAACADDAMDVRWVTADEAGALPMTPTMWPLLEKLFGRPYGSC